MSKRVIDLSGGNNTIPQRQPQQRFENHSNQPQRSVQVRNALLQDVHTPTYTTKDVGPFENVRQIQQISSQNQVTRSQQVHHHPVQHTQQATPPQSQQEHVKKDTIHIVNGCDISGCASIADVYEKNGKERKIQFILS